MSNEHYLQFQREKTALKYFLIGRGYHLALKALGFVERYNVGLRKDGKTPGLHHEVQIALSVSQVKDVSEEELCIVVSLLHDVQEDHQIPSEDIEREFGKVVREAVWKLTKKYAGTIKNKKDYIEAIALCPIASIVKGLDRVNNLQSMIEVFTIEKITDYTNEADNIFLPMLKKAGKLFPEQQAAYHAISQQMKHAIAFARAYVRLSEISERAMDTAEQAVGLNDRATKNTDELIAINQELAAELKRVKEASCTDRLNKEAFKKAIKAVLETCKFVNRSPHDQIMGIRDVTEKLRADFGISQLELTQFTDDLVNTAKGL